MSSGQRRIKYTSFAGRGLHCQHWARSVKCFSRSSDTEQSRAARRWSDRDSAASVHGAYPISLCHPLRRPTRKRSTEELLTAIVHPPDAPFPQAFSALPYPGSTLATETRVAERLVALAHTCHMTEVDLWHRCSRSQRRVPASARRLYCDGVAGYVQAGRTGRNTVRGNSPVRGDPPADCWTRSLDGRSP
jgi:hypothetical protein